MPRPFVLVTGHTSGLGLELSMHFSRRRYEVRGVSRGESGIDLSTKDGINETISQLRSYQPTVFINNAHAGFCQTELAYEWFNLFQDTFTTMITIGSESSEYTKNFMHRYAIEKHSLDEAVRQLQNIKSKCRIIHARFGYIDTPRVKNVEAPKLTPLQAANAVMWAYDFGYVKDFLVTTGYPHWTPGT